VGPLKFCPEKSLVLALVQLPSKLGDIRNQAMA